MTELTVDTVEELDIHRAEYLRRFSLLDSAGLDECTPVGRAVPGPFRPVGADGQVHDGSSIGPLGEACAAPELDVVRVRADRQDPARSGQVERCGHARFARFTRAGNDEIMVQA